MTIPFILTLIPFSSLHLLEAIRVDTGVPAFRLVLGGRVCLVQLLKIDLVTLSAYLFLVADELTVRELIWCVLNERVRLFGSLPGVEVHFEVARSRSLLRVHLVLEVD